MCRDLSQRIHTTSLQTCQQATNDSTYTREPYDEQIAAAHEARRSSSTKHEVAPLQDRYVVLRNAYPRR